jgi:hypothetical protein
MMRMPRCRSSLSAVRTVVAIGALFGLGCGSSGHGSHGTPTPTLTPVPATPTATPCVLGGPFCGTSFEVNTVAPTTFGPAWADVITSPKDFYPCFGHYALCYYSNCTVSNGTGSTVSDCPCFDWYGTNYVLINGDLSLSSYQATVDQCTNDPSSCQIPNGAPVCAEINNGTFYSGAKTVSTFGFYRAKEEPIGTMDCTQEPGLYSGCMTGPCFGDAVPDPSNNTVTIHCDCPNYDGPFQIGKAGESCDDSPMTWSAAYNAVQVPSNPCDLVNGCVVDAPTDSCGCPLYTSGTALPPDSGIDCSVVCQEYASCNKGSTHVELGYTCDATICTSTQHDLIFGACQGLEQCDLSEIFKAESAAQCSCCASQLCGCTPNADTNVAIYTVDAAQRQAGETPQCDINGTLCGTPP